MALPLKLGRTVGTYKGHLFRSLYEYSFYKHMEAHGIPVEGIQHEPYPIPYLIRGRHRRYYPDFLLPSRRLLVEVKCERELARRKGKLIRAAKFRAAHEHCLAHDLIFLVVTELNFPIIPGRTARLDPAVLWIKRKPRA